MGENVYIRATALCVCFYCIPFMMLIKRGNEREIKWLENIFKYVEVSRATK